MVKGQVGLLVEIDYDYRQTSKCQVKKRPFFGEIFCCFFKNTYAFKTVHGDGNVLLSLQVQSLHEHCSKETGEDSANPRAFYAAPKLTNFFKEEEEVWCLFFMAYFSFIFSKNYQRLRALVVASSPATKSEKVQIFTLALNYRQRPKNILRIEAWLFGYQPFIKKYDTFHTSTLGLQIGNLKKSRL